MARQTIRFGIIGAGLMGHEFAVASARWPALLDLDVAPVIVGVCDTNPALFDWYRDTVPTLRCVTTDYRELLANPDVDAVYCAVPHHLHADLYTDIIAAGKPLLAEKPVGIDLAANERIMAAMRAHPEVLVRVSSEYPFYRRAAHRAGRAGGALRPHHRGAQSLPPLQRPRPPQADQLEAHQRVQRRLWVHG